MSQQRRINLTLILTLTSGAILVFLSRNRSVGEVIPLVIGVLIFIGVVQYILLFRGQRTGIHPELRAAQQSYVQGQFQVVIKCLDNALKDELSDEVRSSMLTLKGNTHRQLGQVEASLQVLREAVQIRPQDHFPLYGLGRTLLVMGDYAEAEKYLRQALTQGAKKTTRAELALTQYYGEWPAAEVLEVARQAGKVLRMEPYRALMVNFILYQLYGAEDLSNDQQRDVAQQIMRNTQQGLAFWQAESERFRQTPYGQRLAEDVTTMWEIIEA